MMSDKTKEELEKDHISTMKVLEKLEETIMPLISQEKYDIGEQNRNPENAELWKKVDEYREKIWKNFNSLLPDEKVEYMNELESFIKGGGGNKNE